MTVVIPGSLFVPMKFQNTGTGKANGRRNLDSIHAWCLARLSGNGLARSFQAEPTADRFLFGKDGENIKELLCSDFGKVAVRLADSVTCI